MQVNFVLNAELDLINGSGSGNPAFPTAPGTRTALQIRQLQFSVATVAAGNARVAMQMTAGAIYSNRFPALDPEEVETGLLIDGPSVANNRLSGTIVASHTIRATAGIGNVLSDFSPAIYAGGSLFAGPPVGITLVENGQGGIATPAFPDSGIAYRNESGRPYMVYASVASTTFLLNPMDSVSAAWATTRPTWVFVPAD